tara:strand:- start:239 stop:640 length:402 start_codon:yes stop_codon:yes gene_type:complete
MSKLNFYINLINLFLIFTYFILINIVLIKKEFEYLIIFLITINFIIKFYNWYNLKITKKKNLKIFINNIFFNDRYTKLSIFIFSFATPIYMIFQKDILVIDLFIEKFSFLLVFIFSLIGFYLEFFVLESKSNK